MLEWKFFTRVEMELRSSFCTAKTKWIILWLSVWNAADGPNINALKQRHQMKRDHVHCTLLFRTEFGGTSFGCITNCLVLQNAQRKPIEIFNEWWQNGWHSLLYCNALDRRVSMRAWVCVCRLVSLFRVNRICICKNFNLVLVNVCTILWIYPKKVLFDGVPRVYNRWHQRVPLLTISLVCTQIDMFGKCFVA